MNAAMRASTPRVIGSFEFTLRIQSRLLGQKLQMTAWDH